MYDSRSAVGAALQGMRQPLPFRIAAKHFSAFRDGLKNVVEIMYETFERKIGNCHKRLPCDAM